MRSILSRGILTPLPGSRLRFFIAMQIQYPLAHFSKAVLIGSYAQNPGFEIVREESVKVYLHMHNGNVQQNPPCVESCVTNGFSISPRLSTTVFDPDANSVLLRAHLYSSRLHKYSGNVQQNPLRVESSCVTKVFSIFPRFSNTIFYRDANSVLLQILAHLSTAVLIDSIIRRTLGLKLFVRRA